MFAKLLDKMLDFEPSSLCCEVKTNSGLTVTVIGERSLSTVFEMLSRFGFVNPSTPTDLPALEHIEGDEAPLLTPTTTVAHPFIPNFEGRGLVTCIKQAMKDAVAENTEAMEQMVKDLMARADVNGHLTIIEARELFFASFDKTKKHHTSVTNFSFFFSSFTDLVGNKKLRDIKSEDVNDYLRALDHLPPDPSKNPEYKGLSFKAIVKRAMELKAKAIQTGTKKKHINFMRRFFNWCYQSLDLQRNPASCIDYTRYKKSKVQSRTAFETEDLIKIFDRKLVETYYKPHKFFAPPVALLTGMRVNEILQMYVDDIVYVEIGLDKDGQPIKVPCFKVEGVEEINASGTADKHVKTVNAERVIPIHPKLIEMGFLDYAEDLRRRGLKYLFPGVKRGKNGPGAVVSSWFNKSLLRTKCKIEDHTKTFHSFRNTFWTLGDRSRVLVTSMRKLAGYNAGENVEQIHYIKRSNVKECLEALTSIQYPAIDFVAYDAKKFEKYLDKVRAKATPEELVSAPVMVTKKPGRPPKAKPPQAPALTSVINTEAMAPFDEDED